MRAIGADPAHHRGEMDHHIGTRVGEELDVVHVLLLDPALKDATEVYLRL